MNAVRWQPLQLQGRDGSTFAARHVWCVGRNFAAHAREMGSDPAREDPVFFSKPAATVVQDDEIRYPPLTAELHHEVELVLLLGAGGRDLSKASAMQCIFAYAVGCDLTRRDVQARAKAAGQPWTLAKGFDQSAPVGQFVSAAEWQPESKRTIELTVNDQPRQHAVLGEMIWPIDALLARLSAEVTLQPGDVVFTGTPAGVGPLVAQDIVRCQVDGLPPLEFMIRA